jgi:hypothetical protein
MDTLPWLNEAISLCKKGNFTGSKNEGVFWETIAKVEKNTACDPVRKVAFLNEDNEHEKDMLVVSFSYFSIAVLGIQKAIESPTKYIVIIGQEEDIKAEHLHPSTLLLEPLYRFLEEICIYSKVFDDNFRKQLDV